MTLVGEMMSGARTALMIGFTLMIVNGITARLSPTNQTLTEIITPRVANLGGMA